MVMMDPPPGVRRFMQKQTLSGRWHFYEWEESSQRMWKISGRTGLRMERYYLLEPLKFLAEFCAEIHPRELRVEEGL